MNRKNGMKRAKHQISNLKDQTNPNDQNLNEQNKDAGWQRFGH